MFFGFLVPFHAQLNVRVGPVMGTVYKQSVPPPLRFNGVHSRMRKQLQHGYISLFHALLHVAHTTASPAPASSPAPVSETRELVPVRGRRGAPHGLRIVVVGSIEPSRKRRSVVTTSSVWGANGGDVFSFARVLAGKAVPLRRSIQRQLSRHGGVHRKT